MGPVCPASPSLCHFKLCTFVGSPPCSSPIPPFLLLNFPTVLFNRPKPLFLKNSRNFTQTSKACRGSHFGSFYSSNSNSGGDSDNVGKRQRWNSTNVAHEGLGVSSGPVSDKVRNEVLGIGAEEEEKDDPYGTEARDDSSRRSGRSLWDFLKLRREKEPRAVTEKGTGLDGEKIDVQWRDALDPTPENLLALLLTGLLGFAVVRIFWQLLLVAVTIIIAAFKYSVIAAILVALLVVFL